MAERECAVNSFNNQRLVLLDGLSKELKLLNKTYLAIREELTWCYNCYYWQWIFFLCWGKVKCIVFSYMKLSLINLFNLGWGVDEIVRRGRINFRCFLRIEIIHKVTLLTASRLRIGGAGLGWSRRVWWKSAINRKKPGRSKPAKHKIRSHFMMLLLLFSALEILKR